MINFTMADQVKYTQKLKGDKVLVIGGSAGMFTYPQPGSHSDANFDLPGIGFGVAEACLENGCTVIISSSNTERVEKAVANLQGLYPSAKVCRTLSSSHRLLLTNT